jgi:hypothetical protein
VEFKKELKYTEIKNQRGIAMSAGRGRGNGNLQVRRLKNLVICRMNRCIDLMDNQRAIDTRHVLSLDFC